MADPTTATAPTEHPKPTSWLHWLLLYPALATSLFAAVPTVWNEVKAWHLGVASSQLQLVQEQARLWERNLPCLTERGVYEVDGPKGLVVKVSLCATGDALLRYHQNDWVPIYRWVALPVEKVTTR